MTHRCQIYIPMLAMGMLLLAGCMESTSPPQPVAPGDYQRIVSMAPSVTEILYALDLQDRLVGVTRYCTYPPEAQDKTTIGGYLDPNYEAVLALNPDLIFMTPYHSEAQQRLTSLGLQFHLVRQESLEEIVTSVEAVATYCGVEDKDAVLAADMRTKIKAIQNRVAELSRPRVLIVVGRDYSVEVLEQVFISGSSGFHGRLVDLSGGENVYTDTTIAYPNISPESILHMNPDVILEMIPEFDKMNMTGEYALRAWQSLPGITAVKHGRIHILKGDYVSIPGPRIVDVLNEMAEALHPELREATP